MVAEAGVVHVYAGEHILRRCSLHIHEAEQPLAVFGLGHLVRQAARLFAFEILQILFLGVFEVGDSLYYLALETSVGLYTCLPARRYLLTLPRPEKMGMLRLMPTY